MTSAKDITRQTRIQSIDIIRGLTILVMIFVNDIGGIPGTPVWMMHVPHESDGMTFVDLVFPSFLFIVGMSMPFSIGRRIEKGESHFGAWKHILTRVSGLLIIGVLMVNSDRISGAGIINPHLWIFLMYICVIIIWNKNKDANPNSFWRIFKYAAITGLVVLFFLFRGEHQSGLIQIRTYWWGIIGLIGWAI